MTASNNEPCEACDEEEAHYHGKPGAIPCDGSCIRDPHHALIARLRAELVSSKSREWPEAHDRLRAENDKLRAEVEELRTCFNTEQGLVKQGEELRLQAVKERDAAMAALRNLVNAASGMLWHDNRHVVEARRVLGSADGTERP